jgi:hypothetical protein
MRTPQGHKKVLYSTSEVKKKPKTHMESVRQSLQAQPKILKELSKQQICQSKGKHSLKNPLK